MTARSESPLPETPTATTHEAKPKDRKGAPRSSGKRPSQPNTYYLAALTFSENEAVTSGCSLTDTWYPPVDLM